MSRTLKKPDSPGSGEQEARTCPAGMEARHDALTWIIGYALTWQATGERRYWLASRGIQGRPFASGPRWMPTQSYALVFRTRAGADRYRATLAFSAKILVVPVVPAMLGRGAMIRPDWRDE